MPEECGLIVCAVDCAGGKRSKMVRSEWKSTRVECSKSGEDGDDMNETMTEIGEASRDW